MEQTSDRKPSFDITDHRQPPSPAPTYHSTSYSWSSKHSKYTWEDEKPQKPTTQDSKSPYPTDDKSSGHGAFEPAEEPFDTSHPHFIPPPPTPYPSNPAPSRKQSRIPPLRLLLPWTLALLFFLTTLWYTGIALGIRFFSALHPSPILTSPSPPSINIVINGQEIISHSPTPTAEDNTGNNPDLGTNTITSGAAVKSSETQAQTSFVTVARSRRQGERRLYQFSQDKAQAQRT